MPRHVASRIWGAYVDRVTQLESFLRQDPANLTLALEYVDALVACGRAADGQAYLDDVPTAWLVEPVVLFRVARCALARADYSAAGEPLRPMRPLGQDDAAVRHDLAYALLGMGDVDGAESALAPLVPRAVVDADVGMLHARILQYRFAYDDAALILRAITTEHPRHAAAWGLLAMIEVDRAAHDAGRAAGLRALELDPRQADALAALGTLSLEAHDGKASYEAFANVLTVQPEHGRALAGAGEALLLLGDVASARPLLDRATRAMPGHLGTWHARAWSALLAGDVDTAGMCFETALAVDRNFGESHGGVALVQVLRGANDDARQTVRVALRLDPSGRNARYAQSLLWRAEGREREAEVLVAGILGEVGIDTADRTAQFIASLQSRLRGNAGA